MNGRIMQNELNLLMKHNQFAKQANLTKFLTVIFHDIMEQKWSRMRRDDRVGRKLNVATRIR